MRLLRLKKIHLIILKLLSNDVTFMNQIQELENKIITIEGKHKIELMTEIHKNELLQKDLDYQIKINKILDNKK